MMKVILGPPGTGKTTTLLNLVDEQLSIGSLPSAIGFISFTKKSVNEAKDRAAKRFNKEPRWFEYFRTIHSLAFRQLGMSTAEVIQRRHLVELGNSIGIPIKGFQQMDREIFEMQRGDQLVFLESLSRLMCVSYEECYNKFNPDLSWQEFKLYFTAYKEYKSANLLYDFTDMLDKFLHEGTMPKLKVLFVDEAQDLCPLQWKIVERMAEQSEKTYIAGDDDQAIFRWSGADIDYFINLAKENDNEVLHQSYRLPRSIHKVALSISSGIKNRAKKEFLPRSEEGEFNYAMSIEDIDMDKGQWLVLVRNSYLEKGVVKHLRLCGYSYESKYDTPIKEDGLKAAMAWEAYRAKRDISIGQLVLILGQMSKKNATGNARSASLGRKSDELITAEQALTLGQFTTDAIWHVALDNIGVEDREYYIAARKRGESFVDNPRIKVSTIHGAKGGEEDNVVLLTDISARTYRGMNDNYDDELRVFYVGITRAKEKLWVVQPSTNYYFQL